MRLGELLDHITSEVDGLTTATPEQIALLKASAMALLRLVQDIKAAQPK
jgi:hypothetical protein